MNVAQRTARYLALGDSYTIGEGVPASARWPVRLVQALRTRGVAIDEPRIIATTGWTTDELAAAIAAQAPSPPYDLVSLLIGVNNQYRGRPLDNYREEFSALLATAIALAGGVAQRVVTVSIPDWGLTPFAVDKGVDGARVGAEIDAFNAAARTLAHRQGVAFVDVTSLSRSAPDDPHWLTGDGLHPSATQYAAWADAILEPAGKALSGMKF